MKQLAFPLLLMVILFSCEKKINDNLPSDRELNLHDVRSSNSISNEVTTPEPPPASIAEDLTVPNQEGTDINVITASEYNALEPIDQIYYTGLKNSIQYLLQEAENVSTILQFNADGSYTIAVKDNSDSENSDAEAGGGSCRVCGLQSAFSCKSKVTKYMKDNNLKTITATITVESDGCVKVVYHDYGDNAPTPDPSGTIVETYPPATTPPFTFTFPLYEFQLYIEDVKNWAAALPRSGESETIDPSSWIRRELIDFIGQFNQSGHSHIHMFDAEFQRQLKYYVNNIWTQGEPQDTE